MWERKRQVRDEEDGLIKTVTRGVRFCAAVKRYYNIASAIDEHNHIRQGTLAIERKIGTKSWEWQVMCTIIGMMEVDAWRIYNYCNPHGIELTHKHFLREFTTFLLKNNYDGSGREREGRMRHRPAPPPPAINVSGKENEIKRTYFMPVWEFKQHFDPKCKDKDLADVKKLALRCRVCAQSAKMVCLTCSNTKTGKGFGICGPSSRNKCCNAHLCK